MVAGATAVARAQRLQPASRLHVGANRSASIWSGSLAKFRFAVDGSQVWRSDRDRTSAQLRLVCDDGAPSQYHGADPCSTRCAGVLEDAGYTRSSYSVRASDDRTRDRGTTLPSAENRTASRPRPPRRGAAQSACGGEPERTRVGRAQSIHQQAVRLRAPATRREWRPYPLGIHHDRGRAAAGHRQRWQRVSTDIDAARLPEHAAGRRAASGRAGCASARHSPGRHLSRATDGSCPTAIATHRCDTLRSRHQRRRAP